ncbi:AI-2E family transporter [Leptolyngbya sp. BL0902]|uniref:AI-2E family transporter n=1 Tax=Leptolyngbya sp. BL0902 TaxID=1115757 RepID=UPI0018E815EB|nr:AI-2E family transporter [Leptolyngbya sp. BL0902]QQE64987.1 AI-2E family transporter [Leptolyngbya sp. BL0902]
MRLEEFNREPPAPDDIENTEAEGIWSVISNHVLIRFLLLFASGWALIQLLAYFRVLIAVFVTATILAFLLSHPATWLSRWLPKALATIAVFLTALAIAVGLSLTLGTVVISQGQQLVANLQSLSASVMPWVNDLDSLFRAWNIPVQVQGLEPHIQSQAVSVLTAGLGLLQSTLANLVLAILIAVVTLFMMLDGAKVWWWLLKHLPIRHKKRFNTVVQHNLLGFFWGLLLLSLFFGGSTFLVFLLLGIPYAAFLGLIAGLLDLIPGIGATLGVGLITLLLLSQSAWMSLTALVVCVALQQVQENLLLPYVMKDSLDINPVVMFFALIVGATVAGVLGLFLAVPVAGVMITWLEIDAMRGKSTSD